MPIVQTEAVSPQNQVKLILTPDEATALQYILKQYSNGTGSVAQFDDDVKFSKTLLDNLLAAHVSDLR